MRLFDKFFANMAERKNNMTLIYRGGEVSAPHLPELPNKMANDEKDKFTVKGDKTV